MYSQIKEVIKIFDYNKIDYWIFGGIAVECLRGRLTREHDDIDVLVQSQDRDKLVNILSNREFNIEYKSENFYRAIDEDFQIDILFSEQKGDLVVVDGLKAKVEIPQEFFYKSLFRNLDNLRLRIAPLEFILRTLLYYDVEEDRYFLIDLLEKFNIERIKKVKYFCKRKPNDRKLKLFEKRREFILEKYAVDPSYLFVESF